MGERFRERIDALEDRYFVGREREIALFDRWLRGESEEIRIWNVYGTGGMGKTTLLDRFGRMAAAAGALYLYIDSRDFFHAPEALAEAMHRRLDAAGAERPKTRETEDGFEGAVRRLNDAASLRQVVLAFDTFEEMGDMEHWLRETLLSRLDSRIKLILSGRHSLRGKWLTSPAWRQVVMRVPIGQLRPEQVRDYLRNMGFKEGSSIETLSLRTKGHPLTLSLAAFFYGNRGADGEAKLPAADESEFVRALADTWLREVPDALRELTEAAAALRRFHRDALSAVLERPVPASDFDRLISLSFVRATERGWAFHDVMRDTVAGLLRLRSPDTYRELQRRIIRYYYETIVASERKESMTWELSELVSYIGNSIMRAYMQKQGAFEALYSEPLTVQTVDELERYRLKLETNAALHRERWVDPDSGEEIDLSFHLKEELPVLRSIDFRFMLRLDPDAVRLFRKPGGELAGFLVFVPIHAGTLEALREMPYSRAYFNSLSGEELAALRVDAKRPAGWFIRAVNIEDPHDPQGTFTAFQTIFSAILRGGLIVVSPPPIPLFQDTYRGLGFEPAQGVTHRDYDGKTDTPIFVLDTRGDRLIAYLQKLVSSRGEDRDATGGASEVDASSPAAGRPTEASAPGTAAMSAAVPAAVSPVRSAVAPAPGKLARLSEREQEVATLVLEGYTNAEIAERLFVSEVTVKKHLTSIFQKLEVKNRVSLVKAITES